jgi:hypothetical protein
MHVYYLLQTQPTSDDTFDTAVSSAHPFTRRASYPPDTREEFLAAAGSASHSYVSTQRPTAIDPVQGLPSGRSTWRQNISALESKTNGPAKTALASPQDAQAAETMKPQPPALSHKYAGAIYVPDESVQNTRLRQVAMRRHVDNLGDLPAKRKPSVFQSNGVSDPKPVSSPSSTLRQTSMLETQGNSSEGPRPFSHALLPFMAHERGGKQSQEVMGRWLDETMDRIFRTDQKYRIPYTHKGHLVLPHQIHEGIKQQSPPSGALQRPREAGPDARAIWAAADSRAGVDLIREQGRWEPKTTGSTSYERPPQKRKSRGKDDICASSTPLAKKAATQRAHIPLADITLASKRVKRSNN